jgi:serine/threonine protein kinase
MSSPRAPLPQLPAWVKSSDPNLDFHILETIGKGAFGTVCKAAHRETQQLVAVKRIALAEFGDDVKTELAVQKECNHECIVNFVCSYCWQGDLWIVMEFVAPPSPFNRNLNTCSVGLHPTPVAAPSPSCALVTPASRYCSGGSLTDIIGALEQPLTEEEIAWVCSCCARGLSYMHSQRKIHRDIKVTCSSCAPPSSSAILTAHAVRQHHGHR